MRKNLAPGRYPAQQKSQTKKNGVIRDRSISRRFFFWKCSSSELDEVDWSVWDEIGFRLRDRRESGHGSDRGRDRWAPDFENNDAGRLTTWNNGGNFDFL